MSASYHITCECHYLRKPVVIDVSRDALGNLHMLKSLLDSDGDFSSTSLKELKMSHTYNFPAGMRKSQDSSGRLHGHFHGDSWCGWL